MNERIVLLCAPAGCGFKEACASLVATLKAEGGAANVVFEDVEDRLCQSGATVDSLRGKIDLDAPITMREVTYNLTRGTVTGLWRDALRDSIARLKSSKCPHKLLGCHLNLYGGRRREFYSPLDLGRLVDVSHLLLFIDDVYDMYRRLSTPGHLYDESTGIDGYIAATLDEEGKLAFAEETNKQLAFEWKIQVLTALLSWRHSEMLQAESVASQLNAHYAVMGTKQLCEAAKVWLKDQTGQSVYLSHPISRPRGEQRSTGEWPKVVEEFNNLQNEFLKLGLPAIMPTAIDEYRLCRARSTEAVQDLTPRLPRLDKRWPLPSRTVSDLMYGLPRGTEDWEHTDLLLDSDLLPCPESDARLRAFEAHIKAEVPFRDHHLVVCTSSILVYRPCYRSGSFSRGVRAEVEHWTDLLRERAERRAAFVHYTEDFDAVLSGLRSSGDWQLRIRDSLARLLEKDYRLERHVAEQLAHALMKGTVPDSLLDKGVDLQQFHGRNEALQLKATIDYLGSYLSTGEAPLSVDGVAGIWIVKDYEELVIKAPEIAEFLRAEGEPSTEWMAVAKRVAASED